MTRPFKSPLCRRLPDMGVYQENLTVDGQNINYFVRLEENVQKPSKAQRFQNSPIFGGFWTFS